MPATEAHVHDLLDRWQQAKSDRASLDNLWDELARLYRPAARGFVGDRTQGATDQAAETYDSEQARAARDLARGMEAELFPKSERWVELTTEGEIETDDDEATEWLAYGGKRLLAELYDPRAGFQYTASNHLGDLGVFGAAGAYRNERPDMDGLLFQPVHLRRLHWLRDYAGRPDTVFYCCSLSPRQMQQQWPDGSWPREIADILDGGGRDKRALDGKRDVLRVSLPRSDYRAGSPLRRDMPHAELVVDVATRHVIHEGGYLESPWLITEWEVLDNGDIWSPARESLPDVLLLQQMAKTLLRTGHRAADPPLFVASDAVMGPAQWSLRPGSLNFFNAAAVPQGRPVVEQLEYGRHLPLTLEMQQAQRRKVGEAFLRYVMTLPDPTGTRMTATEVLRRNSDKYLLTAAVFGRVETGFTQPMIEGAFSWMVRQSALRGWGPGSPLRPPPDSLAGSAVDFRFMSPTARAHKAAEIGQVATMLEALMPLFQLYPEARHNIDYDEMVRDAVGRITAPRYVRPMDQVLAIREAERQAAEEAAEMAQMQAGGQLIKDVTPAGKALIEGQAEAA